MAGVAGVIERLRAQGLSASALAAASASLIERLRIDIDYLDSKAALRWWHRNVAKTQYGLQGWKRHKVYPDFVFAYVTGSGRGRTVLLETKGLHLKGADDTQYKQRLLERLSSAFRDDRLGKVGELALASADGTDLVCELLFDESTWENTLEKRFFTAEGGTI